MARCNIGPKKLRSKIQPLMPEGWLAVSAQVRGGWRHGDAFVFAISPTGERITGEVNYLTGEPWVAGTMQWCDPAPPA